MKISNIEKEDTLKNLKENKSKILYKFKISDSTSNKKMFIGQCFLIDLNSKPNKIISQSKSIKNLDKLPSILLKENGKLSDNLSLQRSKSQDKRQNFRLDSIRINKKPSQLNEIDIYPPLNYKQNSSTLQTEPKNNDAADEFLKRINRLYYPKHSTIRFLTYLFDDNEKNDLKMIDLKKIKGKNQKNLLFKKEVSKKNNNVNLYGKNKIRKMNIFNGILNNKCNEAYKSKILKLNQQLKNFHKLKVKSCKNKINETLNDLKKLKMKNSVFIEKFKKECDFKFDDDLIY